MADHCNLGKAGYELADMEKKMEEKGDKSWETRMAIEAAYDKKLYYFTEVAQGSL